MRLLPTPSQPIATPGSVTDEMSMLSLQGQRELEEDRYPMYVSPVAAVLKMSNFEPHEEVKGRGDLVQWRRRLGDVVFFSHVWLSTTHPDPEGSQWDVIKSFLSHSVQGKRKVQVFWQQEFLFGPVSMQQEFKSIKYVWIDYLSIPQAPENKDAQRRCISCIYDYVRHSEYFVVVAPPARHRENGILYDYRTWGERGWCRVEMFCNSVAKSGRVIVAESPTAAYINMVGGRDALLTPPGEGKFTFVEDKDQLGPVLEDLIDWRIEYEFGKGDLFNARLHKAAKPQVMAGLTNLRPDPLPVLEDWLSAYKFESPLDGEDEGTGWTPFRYAVYAGRYDLAKLLLDVKADVEAPLKEGVQGVGYHNKGVTVLAGLAFMRDDPAGIRFLTSNWADPNSVSENNQMPLHLAAMAGHMENVKTLVELGGDVLAQNRFGNDSGGCAVYGGHKDAAEWLLERGSRTLSFSTIWGWRPAFNCVIGHGDPNTLQAVLDAKADVNWKNTPLPGHGQEAIRRFQTSYYWSWKEPTSVVALFSQVPGMTPLAGAAWFGNRAAAQVLLDAKAQCDMTNDYSRTPLHHAVINGHIGCMELLASRCSYSLHAKDCWGMTPAMWAQRLSDTAALAVLKKFGAVPPQPLWSMCMPQSASESSILTSVEDDVSAVPGDAVGSKMSQESQASVGLMAKQRSMAVQ